MHSVLLIFIILLHFQSAFVGRLKKKKTFYTRIIIESELENNSEAIDVFNIQILI